MRWMVFSFLLLASCGAKIPKVSTCLYDEPRAIFHCNDPKGVAFDLEASNPKADKLVCLPFTDIGIVLNYCNNIRGK